MGLIDGARGWLAAHQVPERRELHSPGLEFPPLAEQVREVFRDTATLRPWRPASIAEALGVPSIQRCVTLISNGGASLTPQTFRNGVVMPRTSAVIARPNPYETPQAFYRDTFWNMATRGEVVWWIAKYDGDGRPAALVVVPLHELTVESSGDRLRPRYVWGSEVSTRYSPANPAGRFVHVVYARDPGDLRGKGPLQLARAAVSVSVESQEWAATFFAGSGASSVELHSEEELEGDEALDLKQQWLANPPNYPQVTSGGLTTQYHDIAQGGAQMLDAREHQNGDAARMFGVPGALLEFSAPGSSLTYQNITEVFTMFVKTGLAINYLEPCEQALGDLLPSSTAVRFNVEGFERADIKTRFEVYAAAVGLFGADEAAAWARQREGLAPGNVEYLAPAYAPPSVVPRQLPVAASLAEPVRCDGTRTLRGRLEPCGRKLADAGEVFIGRCPRCHKEYRAA